VLDCKGLQIDAVRLAAFNRAMALLMNAFDKNSKWVSNGMYCNWHHLKTAAEKMERKNFIARCFVPATDLVDYSRTHLKDAKQFVTLTFGAIVESWGDRATIIERLKHL
jgi:hypothetical protein